MWTKTDFSWKNASRVSTLRAAIQSLPWRERKVVGLYYYNEATMKDIGNEIGVNESRVSQLHARAIRRLREALGDMNPQQASELRRALVAFAAKRPTMIKSDLRSEKTGAITPACRRRRLGVTHRPRTGARSTARIFPTPATAAGRAAL